MNPQEMEEGLWKLAQGWAIERENATRGIPRGVNGRRDDEFPPIPGARGNRIPSRQAILVERQPGSNLGEVEPQPGPSGIQSVSHRPPEEEGMYSDAESDPEPQEGQPEAKESTPLTPPEGEAEEQEAGPSGTRCPTPQPPQEGEHPELDREDEGGEESDEESAPWAPRPGEDLGAFKIRRESTVCARCGKTGHFVRHCQAPRPLEFCRTCKELKDFYPGIGWRCRARGYALHQIRAERDRNAREDRRNGVSKWDRFWGK